MLPEPEEVEQTTETPTEPTTPASSEEPPRSEAEVELEEVDFSELTSFVEKDGELETASVEQVVEEPEKPAEETPPEEVAEPEKKEESVSTEEKPPEVKAEPEKKEEPPKVEEPPTPEVKMPTEDELQGMYKDHRAKTLPKLEEFFVLSEEDAAALDEQPSKVIPKLAAQMMYDTMLSTYNAVLAAAPSIVHRLIHASNEAKSAETAFFSAWPDLKDPKAKPVIAAAINAYRATNPRASRDDVIQKAGLMAMLNLGMDPTKKAEVITPPAARLTPPKPAGGRNTAQTTPPRPKGEESDNIFGVLAEAFKEEYR